MLYYRETQATGLWVYLLLLGVAVFSLYMPLYAGLAEGEALSMELLLPTLLTVGTLPLVMNLLCLRTEVERERICIRLGFLFPMMWRRLPLDTIASVAVIRYRPLRDAGGWGYRWGKYEGRRCWYYSMRGNRGVLIITNDNKQHVVGSQNPQALAQAIRDASESRG